MSWYLQATCPLPPLFFTKLQHAVTMAAAHPILAFLNQSQPNPWVHANGSPHGHHLHRPWQWAGTSPTGARRACAWHHSIKGQVHQPLAHFLAECGLGHI